MTALPLIIGIFAAIGFIILVLISVSLALSISTRIKRGKTEVQDTIIACLYSQEFEHSSVASLRAGLKESLDKALLLKVRIAAERRVNGKGE